MVAADIADAATFRPSASNETRVFHGIFLGSESGESVAQTTFAATCSQLPRFRDQGRKRLRRVISTPKPWLDDDPCTVLKVYTHALAKAQDIEALCVA